MFFDAEQAMQTVYEVETYRPPVPVRTGPSPFLTLAIGILIGRKLPK